MPIRRFDNGTVIVQFGYGDIGLKIPEKDANSKVKAHSALLFLQQLEGEGEIGPLESPRNAIDNTAIILMFDEVKSLDVMIKELQYLRRKFQWEIGNEKIHP